jgi:hypothetical protein
MSPRPCGDSAFPPLPAVVDPAIGLLVDDPDWLYETGGSDGTASPQFAHLRVWITQTEQIAGRLAVLMLRGVEAFDLTSDSIGAIHAVLERARASSLRKPVNRPQIPLGPIVVLIHGPGGPHDGEQVSLDQVAIHRGLPCRRRIWPTSGDDPNHALFQMWVNTYGRDLLAT